MNVVAIIPARYASMRLPGKPLLNATGKHLIQHVWEQVRAARCVGRVMIATDDERIAAAVRSFGGEAWMTRPEHPSGTDRVAEVARAIGGRDEDIVLNVQGDEPEIEPAYLDRLVKRLEREADCPAATLACPFPPADAQAQPGAAVPHDPADPNCVKVVLNRAGRALYFSRALIPYPREKEAAGERAGWLLHLGAYAYRRAFLLELAGWPPSPLEQVERLEQLRVLEHGCGMAVELVERAVAGIDTAADYDQFVARWRRVAVGSEK